MINVNHFSTEIFFVWVWDMGYNLDIFLSTKNLHSHQHLSYLLRAYHKLYLLYLYNQQVYHQLDAQPLVNLNHSLLKALFLPKNYFIASTKF